jgi:hypothetical protein
MPTIFLISSFLIPPPTQKPEGNCSRSPFQQNPNSGWRKERLHHSILSEPIEAFPRILSTMRESIWAIFRYLGLVLLVLLCSVIEPKDRFTWLMEVLPVLVGIPILWFRTISSPLTPLTQGFPTIHVIIHMGGRHYTYVEVPLDFRIQELFDLGRNPYDRLGHFAQECVRPYL